METEKYVDVEKVLEFFDTKGKAYQAEGYLLQSLWCKKLHEEFTDFSKDLLKRAVPLDE